MASDRTRSTLATVSAARRRIWLGFRPWSRLIAMIDWPVAVIAWAMAPLRGATVWSPPLGAVISTLASGSALTFGSLTGAAWRGRPWARRPRIWWPC